MSPAPAGNQFWRQRSKHGRDTLFVNAEALWVAAQEYFQWCDKHPWKRKEPIKSGEKVGKTMDVPVQRPYSLSGLMLYCDASESYWRSFKQSDAAKHEDFLSVIARIEETITTQQFEGATVGAFNANIISRKLGLADKQEVDHTTLGLPITTKQPDLSKLTDEELRTRAAIDRKTYGA